MRELKFRAWHKTREVMLPTVDIEYLMTKGALITEHKDFVENIYPNIMQFTGLLDKQAVKIYEGDILEVDVGIAKINLSAVFKNGCFALSVPDGTFDDFSERISSHCKVIGNIYENPELLHVKE